MSRTPRCVSALQYCRCPLSDEQASVLTRFSSSVARAGFAAHSAQAIPAITAAGPHVLRAAWSNLLLPVRFFIVHPHRSSHMEPIRAYRTPQSHGLQDPDAHDHSDHNIQNRLDAGGHGYIAIDQP